MTTANRARQAARTTKILVQVTTDKFRTGNRLILIIDAPEDFSPAAKAVADANNPQVQAWEALMWRFQKALPWASPGSKWAPMDRIFSLAQVPDP